VKAVGTRSILKLLEGKEEAHKIEQELKKLEKKKQKVYVSNYTLLELAYILEFNYGLERERIGKILRTILEDPLFKVEEEEVWKEALELYMKGEDLLMALKKAQYRNNGVENELS